MRNRILIAEDDEDIVKILRLYLESDQFEVLSASDGVEALHMIETTAIDLAVLDIMMPKMDGYELTKRIREISQMPILILSAKNEDCDKIFGLNIGADDYMTKPFNPLEIVARVRAHLRRVQILSEPAQMESGQIRYGPFLLDTNACRVTKNEREIQLTATEYKIFLMLARHPGRIYTKVQIYETINGNFFESDENTIMVHISRLREKIEDDVKKPRYIKTVRGLGYKLEKKS